MNLVQVLKKDHREMQGLCKKLKDTTSRAVKTRGDLFETLFNLIYAHTKAEEEALYSTLLEHEKFRDEIMEGYEEHHVVDLLMNEMKQQSFETEQWKAKITVLSELLDHHIKEEEEEIFPKVSRFLANETLIELGQAFLDKKEELVGGKVGLTYKKNQEPDAKTFLPEW